MVLGEIGGDERIVLSRMGEGLLRQLPAPLGTHQAGGVEIIEDRRVIRRVNHHCHRLKIFRRCPNQGWAPDVDLLKSLLARHLGTSDDLSKGIQIDRNQIDRLDAMGGESGLMGGVLALRQDAAVNPGVQGLHTSI